MVSALVLDPVLDRQVGPLFALGSSHSTCLGHIVVGASRLWEPEGEVYFLEEGAELWNSYGAVLAGRADTLRTEGSQQIEGLHLWAPRPPWPSRHPASLFP